jgi:hypothetical protein
MKKMSVTDTKRYSFAIQYAYMLTTFNEDLDTVCKVEFDIHTLPEDYFITDVINDGMALELWTRVPNYFYDEDRVLDSNSDNNRFNENTHKAQAHKDLCERIEAESGMSSVVFCEPQIVELPFACEECIVHTEIQCYANELGELTDIFGGTQFHSVLKVTLHKRKTKRKVKATIRVVNGGGAGGAMT